MMMVVGFNMMMITSTLATAAGLSISNSTFEDILDKRLTAFSNISHYR
jgi:hypothetical protein